MRARNTSEKSRGLRCALKNRLASEKKRVDHAKLRKASVENAARAPHRSPLASNTLSNARKSKRGAKRCAHRQKKQSPPATQSSSTKPDESRQAYYRARAPRPARRRWRRSGTTATPAVGRRDRGADGRADRAGLVRTASKLNDSFKNPIWSKTEQVWSRQRCASAPLRLPVDRTTPRRLAVGPATRGLPAGCPGAPSNT